MDFAATEDFDESTLTRAQIRSLPRRTDTNYRVTLKQSYICSTGSLELKHLLVRLGADLKVHGQKFFSVKILKNELVKGEVK